MSWCGFIYCDSLPFNLPCRGRLFCILCLLVGRIGGFGGPGIPLRYLDVFFECFRCEFFTSSGCALGVPLLDLFLEPDDVLASLPSIKNSNAIRE